MGAREGDLRGDRAALKREDGKDIVLSCGPATLAPLVDVPGLIDELVVILHPAVIGAGPRLFDGLSGDLALRLVEAEVFDAGAVVLRYAVGSDVVRT